MLKAKSLRAFCAASVLSCCTSLVCADLLTVTTEIPATAIPGAGYSDFLEIEQFTPLPGEILTQVDFDLLLDFSGTMGFENTDPNVATFYQLKLTWSLDLHLPEDLQDPNEPPLIGVLASRVVQGLVDPYDGEIDFDGPSGRTFDVVAEDEAGSGGPLVDAEDLAAFTGTGSVALPLTAIYLEEAKAANTILFESLFENVRFEGELSVTYTYIPEPMLAGFVLLVGLALRRIR